MASMGRQELLESVSSDDLEDICSVLSVLDYDGDRETSSEVTVSQVEALLEHFTDEEEDSEMVLQMKERARHELQVMELVKQVFNRKINGI